MQHNLNERKKFVGRISYINEITKQLKSEQQIIILSAFGGTGKTTLANECGYQILENNKEKDYCIRWFRAENSDKLEDDWRQLASLLNIDTSNIKRNNLIDRVNNELNKLANQFLFILDNVEKYEDIIDFVKCLPKKNTKVLITTRNSQLFEDIDSIKLESFDVNEAKLYLSENLKRFKNLTDDNKSLIIDLIQIDGQILPLKLSLTVKYIESKYVSSFEKILDDIRKNSNPTNQVNDYLFKDLSSKILRFLVYCSFFNPDLISLSIVSELDENAEESLGCLRDLGLIDLNMEKRGIKLHRLVQHEVRKFRENNCEKFENKSEIIDLIICILDKITPKIDRHVTHNNNESSELIEQQYSQVKDILLKVDDNIENIKLNNKIKLTNLRNKLGLLYLYYENNYYKAKECFESNLKSICDVYENDHEEKAFAINNFGLSFLWLGDYTNAIIHFHSALRMHERIFKTGHVDIPCCYMHIGVCYSFLGHEEKSIHFKEKSLEIFQQLKINENKEAMLDMAQAQHNLSISYLKTGKIEKAIELEKRALEICDFIYKQADNPSKARYFQQLGMCYSKIGNESLSIEYAAKALEMRERLYHKFHPVIPTSLNDLGTCYSNLGNEIKAMEYFNKALEIRMDIFKGNSSAIANSYRTISASYEKLGDEKKANEYNELASLMQAKLKFNEN